MARMALLHDPDGAPSVLFGTAPSVEDLIEARGIGEKLSALSGKITDALGKAARGVKIDRFSGDADQDADPDLIKLRAWARQDYPENVVSTTELLYLENDRVISALLAHLAEHIVIGEELKSLAAAARRRAADEMARAPSGMLEFIGRLAEAGIVVDDVRKMRADRLAAVVRTIKDDGASAEATQANEPEPVGLVSAVVDEVSAADLGAMPGNMVSSTELATASTDALADEQAALDGRWDHLDLCELGYRIEESEPDELEAERVAGLQLPTVSYLHELALDTGPENLLARGVEATRNSEMMEKFFRRWGERVGASLSKEEQRLWGLLLVEMPFRERAPWMREDDWRPNRMGDKGYFDGLVLPPRTGSKRVRRIVTEDRTDLSRALPRSE